MLRNILHWCLLCLAILLWLAAALGTRKEDAGREPAHIAALVSKDLSARAHQADKLSDHPKEVKEWIGLTAATNGSNWVAEQAYFLYAYRGDSLVAWSTTSVLPPALDTQGRLYKLPNGTYFGYALRPAWLAADMRLSLLFPIAYRYPFSNEYLLPAFTASPAIDPHVAVSDTGHTGAEPLRGPKNNIIGYVYPPPTDDLPEPPADWIVWCWLASLVVFAVWLNGWALRLGRNKGWTWGAALVIVVACGIRIALLLFEPPFRIASTDLFSPRLYASSVLLPSLGSLLLHVLALLWILLFIAPRIHFSRNSLPAAARWLLALLACTGLFAAGILFIRLSRSLVLDSLIPFDAAHLSAMDGNSLMGLLVVSLLLGILLIIAGVVRNALRALMPMFSMQALLLLAAAGIVWALFGNDPGHALYAVCILWLSVDILGQHVERLREGAGIFRVGNIFWSIAHCLLLALLMQHFTRIREVEARKSFAEHVATRHDDAMEYNFGQNLTLIRTDTALVEFLKRPTPSGRKDIDERFAALYFNHALSAYQPRVYFFDADERPLFNPDTTSLEAFWRISTGAIPSRTASDLYFRDTASGDHIYLALLPLEDSLGEYLGAAAIDLEQKRIVSETVLPELLQPAAINQAEKAAGYSYAIYSDRHLVAQTNDYPFPFYILPDTSRAVFRERIGNDNSTLVYTPDVHRSVSVWRRFGTLSETLTLFSYLLLIRFLLLAAAALYRYLGRVIPHPADMLKHLRGVGLRRRLQLSIMGIVALSLLAIGIITIVFLSRQYDDTSKTRRNALMHGISRAIQQWMRENGSDSSPAAWERNMATADFRHFLAGLAADQKTDINLFDAHGFLSTTTQQAIYDQGLLAPVMRHDVLRNLMSQPRALITEIEQIGALRYQSCYTPLRASDGRIAGILNVPLFYAQRELDEQISSVVVTLINLYALALLLSALLAYFITRWITRAFDVIIGQFGRMSLYGNEPLQWPYDDEIGVLVAEYNKMVRKLEESATTLARSEREGAFREMARQVAHEIKNPLTPMNLYVQRLQRAIQADEPDVLALAGRVSEALLEQINNLSAIATEFGAFARIGTARPEPMELIEVVRNVVEPFTADAAVQVRLTAPETPLRISADRSGLVRIVTNLMQNAVQAIPEGRTGRIEVQILSERGSAVLRVADNGAGISPEAAEKLFRPYFTTKSSGTGLGLAMSRQLVESWGGAIAYDTIPGEGTTFIIRLPLLN